MSGILLDAARQIMGEHYLGNMITGADSFESTKVPFSEDDLEEAKKACVLFESAPSVSSMMKNTPYLFFEKKSVYLGEKSFETESHEWWLIGIDALPGSATKTRLEQKALLGEIIEVPPLEAVVAAVVGYRAKTGKCLFQKRGVRTSSVANNGDHFSVATLIVTGLGRAPKPLGISLANILTDIDRSDLLGLAYALKSR